ncbi:DUF4811 domain-containing protein [Lactococcus nasutitermitis]|uniref:DUF4811 domain-containing protein n=1 Tax=Lactococcus nasutitermitis TaxID=1652957 RepID=A0ABV9JG50_9LACT|nr:DUF4811 domain-containing protein [Lactococcus nasutitermitis]
MLILALIIVFGILTFFGFMFLKNAAARYIVGGVSLIILALSVVMLTFHIRDNWGMKEVTTSTSHVVYTAGDKSAAYGMMIKAEIGKNTGNYVLIYRNDKNSKNPDTNFKPDEKNIVEAVKKSATYKQVAGNTAKVTTKTTRRVWKSDFFKVLFGIGDENKELVKQHSVVSVPKDTWLVLTADQVKELQKKAPEMAAAAKKEQEAQVQAAIQKALTEAVANVPAAQKEAAMAAAKPAVTEKVEAAAKAQMAELQNNPKAYAKLQVTQIRETLGIK